MKYQTNSSQTTCYCQQGVSRVCQTQASTNTPQLRSQTLSNDENLSENFLQYAVGDVSEGYGNSHAPKGWASEYLFLYLCAKMLIKETGSPTRQSISRWFHTFKIMFHCTYSCLNPTQFEHSWSLICGSIREHGVQGLTTALEGKHKSAPYFKYILVLCHTIQT